MSNVAVAGKIGAVREKQEYIFDPQTGWQLQETYNGTASAIRGLAGAFADAGLRVATSQRGASWQCRVTFGNLNDGGEVPVDSWGFVAEYKQEDVRSAPKLLEAAGSSKTLNDWYEGAKQALKDKVQVDLDSDPAFVALYDMLARGIEAFETKNIVLRRRRTISVGYVGQVSVTAVDDVYTTSKLVSTFNIPGIISSRLPPDPAYTPSDCTWGWKLRADESDIVLSINKAEEVRDFVFAAWSNYLYNIIA